jgi:serine/threonine protein phosphatase PrpC
MECLPESDDILDFIRGSFQVAHNKIANLAFNDSELIGFGTTICCLIFESNKLHLGWIGDSRIYIYRPGQKRPDKITNEQNLSLLTKDHSIVWDLIESGSISLDDGEKHPKSHIITQSLGSVNNKPIGGYKTINLINDDVVFACTDGVTRHITTKELKNYLSEAAKTDLNTHAHNLSNLIFEKGAEDNFSFILMHYQNEKKQDLAFSKKYLKINRSELLAGSILALVLIMLSNIFLFHKDNQIDTHSIIIENNDVFQSDASNLITNRQSQLNESESGNMDIMLSERFHGLDSFDSGRLMNEIMEFQPHKNEIHQDILLLMNKYAINGKVIQPDSLKRFLIEFNEWKENNKYKN